MITIFGGPTPPPPPGMVKDHPTPRIQLSVRLSLCGDGGNLLGDGVDNLLGDGVNLLGDGIDFLSDGVDLPDDGVAQKCSAAMEIKKKKYHRRTYQRTD